MHKCGVIFLYISNDIAERIKFTAKNKGCSMKKLLESVGLGFNAMSNMKTSMPKADNLAKIADYLDCSVDYLLGRTDVPEINRGSSQNVDALLEEILEDVKEREKLDEMIDRLSDKSKAFEASADVLRKLRTNVPNK